MSLFMPPFCAVAIARHQSAVERLVKEGLKTGPGYIDKEGMKTVFSRSLNAFDFERTFIFHFFFQFVRAVTPVYTCVAPPAKKIYFANFLGQIYDWKHLYLCNFLVRHFTILP